MMPTSRLTLQRGHTTRPDSFTVSADGRLLLTHNYERSILWNAATGRQLTAPDAFASAQTVAFDGDSTDIIAVCNAGYRDAPTWVERRLRNDGYRGAKIIEYDEFTEPALDDQGRFIVLRRPGVPMRIVRLDDTLASIELVRPDGDEERYGRIVGGISADGAVIATRRTHDEHDVKLLWDARTGRLLADGILPRTGPMALDAAGALVAAVCCDRGVVLWEDGRERVLASSEGRDACAGRIAFDRSGRIVAVAWCNGLVELFDVVDDRLLWNAQLGPDQLIDVEFPRSGDVLAIAEGYGRVHFHDIESGRQVRTFDGFARELGSTALGAGGAVVGVASDRHALRGFSATRRTVTTLAVQEPARHRVFRRNMLVYVDPQGRHVALWDERRLVPYALESGHPSVSLEHDIATTRVTFSPDGALLVTGTCANPVIRLDEGREIARLGWVGSDTSARAIDRRNRFLAVADDTTVQLHDIPNDRSLGRIGPTEGTILAIAFRGNDEIATLDASGTVSVWSAPDGERQE